MFGPQLWTEGTIKGVQLVLPANLIDLPQDCSDEAGGWVSQGGDWYVPVMPCHSFGGGQR